MSEHDVEHIKRLIDSKKVELENTQLYLAKVEEQAALYGINTPAKLQLEIEQLEKKISEIQQSISELENKRQALAKNNIDRALVPQPSVYSKRREHQVSIKGIVYWILIIILTVAFVFIDIYVVYPNMQSPVVYEQIIDSSYHHLGDNSYSQEYVDSIVGDKPRNLASEGVAYSTVFDLTDMRSLAKVKENARINKIEIIMFVNHVKSRQTAPILIGVNGEYLAHINDYVKSEEFHREPINILADVPLYEGQNEIEIITGKDTEESIPGFDEYEDFEFDSLGIRISFDEKHLKMWPFILVVLGEALVIGLLGGLLSKSLE
jgi:FtsZ-binding cell division protein ZapB